MDSPLTYGTILLLSIFEFSSGIIFSRGYMEKRFACASQGFPRRNKMIKLYLTSEHLKVRCFFQTENELTSKGMRSLFTSGGLAPSLGITNSTYNGIFPFNLTLFSNKIVWMIEIPRENITQNTDIAAVEEWLVRVTLHHGLNIYATEGTLLDTVREPILQWDLGDVITKNEILPLHPHVVDLKVTKCPCANDVALVAFILDTSEEVGVYIGLTNSGFWDYDSTKWYDMTETIYLELQEEHTELSVMDLVLTNHFLVILTSLGLFVSEDLRYPSGQFLKLSRADFCGFERVDYIKGKLWYKERCFANKEHFEVDYVTITFDRNRTLSEASSCFYSREPFLEWLPCIPYSFRGVKYGPPSVITFLIDQEKNTGIYLFYQKLQKHASVSVVSLEDNLPSVLLKFPAFEFPNSFVPTGMAFHPRSHLLYVYGNQVWLSVDDGNTFQLIADLHDTIKKISHSFYTSEIIFVTQSGKAYVTKAGLERYSETGYVAESVFTIYYDHLGYIHKLTPRHFEADGLFENDGNPRSIFGKVPDMGFETALAPQHLSLHEMIIFAYVSENEPESTAYTKQFNHMHRGKVLHSGKTGIAYIKAISYHQTPKGFLSSVTAEMIDPFAIEDANESSCLSSSLSIYSETSFHYKLTINSTDAKSSFQETDIEKTVVIPGHSSFLILRIVDAKNALAIATMPRIVPINMTFTEGSWFLYNFGQRNGRTWTIHAKPCNYLLQHSDEHPALNMVKYIDLGNSQDLKIKVIPNSEGMHLSEVPLLNVAVGNPTLLEVKAEGYFDDADSYVMEINIASKVLLQGSSSLSFVIWGASVECFVTTVVPTLKSSCDYLRSMHHTPNTIISREDWARGVHRDNQGFNMIKALPINYRPPSNMGIAIPLTDNFYHADPSKPIPRNLYHKSKTAGKYKQCANASRRAECNCTEDQKFSYAVAFSDCREKVPRYKFPVTQYPISLEIKTEDGYISVKSPYLVTVTEVNMRKNWKLKHSVPENVRKMKNYLEPILQASVYNPSGLNLSIKGSELFHFRVSVVPGVTFCNLVEEFQIYVDEAPLPFPGHTLIALAAAVMLGGLIFTAFMFQLRNIHPWTAFQNWLRRNKWTFSNISFT